MTDKKPNKFVAPIIIAGITVGFLASAYKFVFANKDISRADIQKKQDSTDRSQVKKMTKKMNNF